MLVFRGVTPTKIGVLAAVVAFLLKPPVAFSPEVRVFEGPKNGTQVRSEE